MFDFFSNKQHVAEENAKKLAAVDYTQAIIEFDPQGQIITANENFLKTMGYQLEEITGKHHRIFVDPGYAESQEYGDFWDDLAKGKRFSQEFKRVGKGNKDIFIHASYNPLLDKNGSVYKVIKFATDITEAKQVSEENTSIISAIDRAQAVIEFNLDGTIITANDNFLNALGYSLEEVQGKHHRMFVKEEERTSHEYQAFWDKLNRGEFEAQEYERITKSGESIWIQASYNPIFDLNGKPFKVIKFATDITAQKKMAKESKRLADISSALTLCQSNVMLADNDLNIVFMNNEMEASLRKREKPLQAALRNFNADKLIGTNVDQFHKDPSHQRRLLEGLTSTYETKFSLPGVSFSLTASPWLNVEGERIGTLVEWEDITEQLDAERQVEALIQGALQGNLDDRLEVTNYEGFMLKIASGINKMLDTVVVPIKELRRVLSKLSEGDLQDAMNGDFHGEFAALNDALNATMEQLKSTVGNIRGSGEQITHGASEIAQGNATLSQRTEEQAASLEETASSMEEMTATVKQNADNARQANQLAASARDQAEQGGQVASDTATAMSTINDSSKKIAEIIGVIDEIAFQTNLLALNAAVEAARAGDKGRGFAVVASEVRNLAQRSASAAKDIKELINDSVLKVEEGSRLVTESGKSLEEIVLSVKKVSDIVAEIAAASQEQATGIEQVNKAIAQMDEVTQQNAALVEETAAASDSMNQQAQQMMQLVGFFKFDDSQSSSIAPPVSHTKAAVTPLKAGATAVRGNTSTVKAVDDSEWEEF